MSSCGGHYPANKSEVIITYIWREFKRYENNGLKDKFITVRKNLELNPPFLTLVFLDKREFVSLIENLDKFNFENYKKTIMKIKFEDDKNQVKQEIRDRIKKEITKPQILICYFKSKDSDDKDNETDEVKFIEYIITFTCVYQFSPEEKKLSANKKNYILLKVGGSFIETIHQFLKSDIFDFKPLIGELKREQIKDCKCHRLKDLCIDLKHQYLNSRVNLMKKELKIRNEVVYNMLPNYLRTRGILLKNKKFIYKDVLIQDFIQEIDKTLYEFNY